MTETLKLPRQARGVSLRAESFNADDNTIDVVFTTGAAVLRYSWGDGAYLETLDVTPKAVRLDRLNKGAPFLNSHASWDLADVIGSVVPGSARIEGGLGVATIKLSGAAADADIVGKIRDGVIRNVSVGYIVWQAVMTEAGEDGSPATCRVTDWEPIEISAVPIPADMDSQIRSAGGKPDANALYSCAVTRAMPAQPAVETPVAAPTSADDVRKAETSRVQGLIATTRQLGLPADLADKHVAEGTPLDAYRSLAIDAAAALRSTSSTPTSAAPAVQTGETAMTDRATDTHSDDVTRAAPTAPVTPPAPLDAAAIRTQERERAAGIRSIVRKLKLADAVADKAIAEDVSLDAFRSIAIDAAAEAQPAGSFTANPAAADRDHHRTYAAPKGEKPKGTDATRAMIALAATRGSRRDAADFVSQHYGPEGDVVARALSTSVGSAGGFLVPPEMSAEVIELLRPASTVMALEPNILPMPSGNLMIPRIQGGSTANYVGENQPIPASQPSFGMVQLSAKKLTSVVPISNDMIRFPMASTDAIVRSDMVKSIAMRADLAFLRGAGSQFSPRGLRSFAADASLLGANALVASTQVGTTFASQGTNQASTALQSVTGDLSRLELALENANIMMTRPGWIFSPRTKTYLMNIRDGLGNQVYYAEMSKGMLRGKPFKITTQIPNNLAAVASDNQTATMDGSEIYLADFAEVFIGEAYGLELDVFPGGSYVDASGNTVSGISNDQTVMRAIVQHDMNMRQEAAVATLSGVRWF